MSDDVANLKEQLKQVKEDMARQKSEYVQKIKDMEKRFEEDSAMNANVDADDMQDAAEFEAQCDMLELSLSDKIEKLTAANNTIASLKEEAAAKDEAYSSLQAEMAAQASLLAEQKAKVEEAARELEANTQLTRQYKASLDKIRAQQETRIAELKRSHEHEMHQLQERHNEEQQKWAAELRAATDRFTQQRDLLHSQIGKLQTELASRVTQITELEKRIEYLENADHVAEMLAANRKYKAALGIIEQLKGQIELLNCRIAETEKLLTIEKRKLAATQQQLAVAEQSTQDAIASAAAAHNNANHQGDTNGGGSALASFVGQTLQTPRAGSRRGLSGGLSAVNSPSQIRSSGGQRIRVKPIDSPDEQSLDQLRTVHVQSGALPDATGREGGTALQDSTPLQALTTTRAEVSFVQNLELRLQKSRTDNTRLVEEVQKLKKQIVTIEAGKASAIAAAAAEAEANALCATCGRNAEEAERFEREQEEQRRQAEAAAARAAREAAEEAARRFQEDNDMFGDQDPGQLSPRPVAAMGVVTMKEPAAVALESDARAAEAEAAHAKAAAEAAAVAAAMIQFRGVQVSGPQTQAALLMPPGLRITGDLPPGQGNLENEEHLALENGGDDQFVMVSHSDARGRSSSGVERPAQLTSPERVQSGASHRYVPPATSAAIAHRKRVLATPPGLDIPRSSASKSEEIISSASQADDDSTERDNEAEYRARRHNRLWELVGKGM